MNNIKKYFGGYHDNDSTIKFYTRINSLVNEKSEILDLGCGRGADIEDFPDQYRTKLKTFRGKVKKVIGVDMDHRASNNKGLDDFLLMNEDALIPLPDNSIDLIISDFVLEHVDCTDTYFSEVDRVLKNGGYFCGRTTNLTSYITLGSKLIPKPLHNKVLNFLQPSRKEEDIFPAYYRANSKTQLNKHFGNSYIKFMSYEFSEPAYFGSTNVGKSIGLFIHMILPSVFAPCLLVYAKKIK
jgi:ubiquinone/menaquinone biosynthesis C-methylase UbiE